MKNDMIDDIILPSYINPDHPFSVCPSLTIPGADGLPTNKFCSTDDQVKFLKNLKTQPENWRYRTKDVTYKVNSSGYRAKEWNTIDWKNAVVLLGCSCTFGVGQAEDETVHHFLEKILRRPIVNLGFPSGSNHLIIQNCLALIENFGYPYAVGVLWTPTDRFRFFGKDVSIDLGAWNSPLLGNRLVEDGANLADLWAQRYMSPTNEAMELFYLAKTFKLLFKDRCKTGAISYFHNAAQISNSAKSVKIDNDARDLLHPGPKNSLESAKYFGSIFK